MLGSMFAMSATEPPNVSPAGGTAIADRPITEELAQTPWVTIVWTTRSI